ncbi:MAG TPA: hypothetical protein VHN81_13405 [Edaphobacter sp.]|nr:hypothetical protein [Edaphobacter sp.]
MASFEHTSFQRGHKVKFVSSRGFLTIYSGALTVALAAVLLTGAHRSANASFDQITVHRINIVEPDGTTRMVLSDHAEFPGAYYMGKEYPRTDRDATGILFNNDEGTENGGLIFGGKKDAHGVTHSWGHLSFDEYNRDQTLAMESDSEGSSRNTYYAVNDDDRPYSQTPEFSAEWQRIKAMPQGPERTVAAKAWHAKYPGGIINRAYLGRSRDKDVNLTLRDQQGRARLVARVAANGEPTLEFLDQQGKVVRSFTADSK